MKRGSLWLLALLLLLLSALVVLVGSEFGSRRLVALAERVLPLDIELGGGSLATGLHLQRLSLAVEGVELELHEIHLALDHECLWRSALCLEQLAVRSLKLEVLPGGEEEIDRDTADTTELIHFPLDIESDALQVDSTLIRWPGGRWQQGPMRAAVQIGAEGIRVGDASVQGALLVVEEGADDQEPSELVLPVIDLPLRLRLDALRLQDAGVDLAGEEIALETLELSGRWRNRDLRIDSLRAVMPGRGDLALEGSIRFESDWPLQASTALGIDVAYPGSHLLARDTSLELSGTLRALEFAATSEGRVQLTVSGLLNALSEDLSFDTVAAARWRDQVAVGEIHELPETLSTLMLHSPLEVSASGNLDVQSLRGSGRVSGLGYEPLALNLQARYQAGRLQVDELSLADASGENHLAGEGELLLQDALAGNLTLNSRGIDLPELNGSVSGRLSGGLTLSGESRPDAWHLRLASVDITGAVNGLPARVEGYGGLDSSLRLDRSDLQGDVNGTRFQLSAKPLGKTGSARLLLEMDDLGRWVSGARGSANLEATMADIGSELRLRGSLRDISLGTLAVEQGVLTGRVTPDARGDFILDVSLSGLELQGEEVSGLEIAARGDRVGQVMTLEAQGDYRGRLGLEGAWGGDRWLGSLQATAIETPVGSWRLDESIPLRWSPEAEEAVVAAHCWSNQRTRVCPGELRVAERSSGSLVVDGGMGFLAGLFPDQVEVSGTLAVNVSIAWGGGEPLYLVGDSRSENVRITRNFGAGEQATVAWDVATAEIRQGGEGLQATAKVVVEGRPRISMDLLLPQDGQDGEIRGALVFDHLQLGSLSPLVPRLSTLEGDLHGRLQFSGNPAKLRSAGSLDLTDGRLALLGNPTELDQLQLAVELRGDRALLGGTGRLGGGAVDLNGSLDLVPDLRLDLQVSGERHQLLFPPSTDVLLSEKLQLVATDGLLQVRGDVVVHEGMLRHEELPEGSVTVSSNVVVVDYAGNVVREERPFDTGLDVWVRIRDRFNIEGGSLRATVGGDLHLLQEPAQPMQLFGSLNVVGGELSAYRQRLRIKRGTLSFTGPPENPEFNMRAERRIRSNNVTVGVELLGTLDDPQMTVYSDPAMDQSEAMSYLVRGRGLDAGAQADGTALALSMGASVVNQSGVLSGFERLPLISQVQLGTEGSDQDTAATVGGYVGERIYVSYGIGVYEPITVLTARLYFSARLWLEVVSRLENSADLYYSFEIR